MLDHRKHTLGGPVRNIAVAFVLVLALGACGGRTSGDGAGGKPGTIRVALVCGGMTPLTAQIAINAKTFPDGLKVKKLCFDSGSEAVQALIGGSLDVFMGSTEHILSTRAQGLPTKGYAGINNRAPYSLITAVDSDVKSVADLKGETVAVTSPGSLADTELQLAAKENSVAYDSMKVIGAGSGSTMASAISRGQVAAGMVSEPQQSELLQSGDYSVVWEPEFEFASIVAVANSEWVAKNKVTMRAFFEGLSTAANKAKKDNSFAVTTMQDEDFPVSEKALTSAVKDGLTRVPENLVISKEVYTNTTDLLASVEGLKKSEVAPYDEVFDFSFLPESP